MSTQILTTLDTVLNVLDALDYIIKGAKFISPKVRKALEDAERQIKTFRESDSAIKADQALQDALNKNLSPSEVDMTVQDLTIAMMVLEPAIQVLEKSQMEKNLPEYQSALKGVLDQAGKKLDELEIFKQWGENGINNMDIMSRVSEEQKANFYKSMATKSNSKPLIDISALNALNTPQMLKDYDSFTDLVALNTTDNFRKCRELYNSIRIPTRRGKLFIRKVYHFQHIGHSWVNFLLTIKSGRKFDYKGYQVEDYVNIDWGSANNLSFSDGLPWVISDGLTSVTWETRPKNFQSQESSYPLNAIEFGRLAIGVVNDVVYYHNRRTNYMKGKMEERDNILNWLKNILNRK